MNPSETKPTPAQSGTAPSELPQAEAAEPQAKSPLDGKIPDTDNQQKAPIDLELFAKILKTPDVHGHPVLDLLRFASLQDLQPDEYQVLAAKILREGYVLGKVDGCSAYSKRAFDNSTTYLIRPALIRDLDIKFPFEFVLLDLILMNLSRAMFFNHLIGEVGKVRPNGEWVDEQSLEQADKLSKLAARYEDQFRAGLAFFLKLKLPAAGVSVQLGTK